ncbi:MAG TPA: hypothetical protein VM513_25210 [Kofleriaceae bacterium]|jgi:hypothetical protein|nr:hypothetical protein [Kofleriaceae bacterium]
MKRLGLLFLVLAGCGDDGGSSSPADAPIDQAPGLDGTVCGAPTKLCGTTCLAVNEDEMNCGDCGVECKGGQACETTCVCPTPFVPATLTPTNFDQLDSSGGVQVAISPNINGSINPVIIGYPATDPVLDTDIDLSTIPLGQAPFVGAAYRFDLTAMTTDANYVATAGTLNLTSACSTSVEGTLTNATFRGIVGDLQSQTVTVDPEGCMFTVETLAFHIGATACP